MISESRVSESRVSGYNKYTKYIVPAALAGLLLFGFYLRSYHIDYPSVGYHNMKENQHLSETLNFYLHGLSIHREVFFQAGDKVPPYYEEYPQLPLIPYTGYALWKIFGISFWTMRLQIICYSLGTILAAFFLVRRLTGDALMALLTAAVMTVLPINVFYGRNIQPESQCLLFLMLFFIAFLKWKETYRPRHAAAAGMMLALTALTKTTFLVPALSVLAVFPYSRAIEDLKARNFKPYVGFATVLLFPLYLLITRATNVHETLTSGFFFKMDPRPVFSWAYWKDNYGMFKNFFIDNYSGFLGFMLCYGLITLPFTKSDARKFFIAYAATFALLYMPVFNLFLSQHNYYQMPYVLLSAFCVANGMDMILSNLTKEFWGRYLRLGSFIVLALAMGGVVAGINRQFDTQFFGMDAAGEYILKRTAPTERFMHMASAQYQGVCFFARRFCAPVPENPSDLKKFERRFGSRFIYIKAAMLGDLTKYPSWKYVSENYRVVQAGGIMTPQGFSLTHLILEGGSAPGVIGGSAPGVGGGSASDVMGGGAASGVNGGSAPGVGSAKFSMDDIANAKPIPAKEYEFTGGNLIFYVKEP